MLSIQPPLSSRGCSWILWCIHPISLAWHSPYASPSCQCPEETAPIQASAAAMLCVLSVSSLSMAVCVCAPRFSVKTKGSPSARCQGHEVLPEPQSCWAQLRSQVPCSPRCPCWALPRSGRCPALRTQPGRGAPAAPEQHLRLGRGRTRQQGGTGLSHTLSAAGPTLHKEHGWWE